MRNTVSILDIARKAKCNPTSVSQVLNDSPLPSKRMREKVQKTAKELGYVPNRLAQALKKGRSSTLGVIMPYAAEAYYASFLDAVSDEATERGYRLDIHFHKWSSEKEDQIFRLLAEAQVEGAIVYACRTDYQHADSTRWLRDRGVPLLAINARTIDEQPFFATASKDVKSGVYQLGEHLGHHGHQNVDYFNFVQIQGCENDVIGKSKIEALREGLLSVNSEGRVNVFEVFADYLDETEEARQFGVSARRINRSLNAAVEKYLDRRTDGTAVFVLDETVGLKLLAQMQKRGMRCPEDLSVVCLSTEDGGAIGITPLTAVEFSVEEIARKSVDAVLAAIQGQKVPGNIVVQGKLVPRQSVRSLTPSLHGVVSTSFMQ